MILQRVPSKHVQYDLSLRLRSSVLQYHMSLPCIREGEDSADSRFQFAGIDQRGNLAQALGSDLYQEEGGANAGTIRSILVGFGHRRNQVAASPQNLKGTCLRFASNKVKYRVCPAYF